MHHSCRGETRFLPPRLAFMIRDYLPILLQAIVAVGFAVVSP